MPATTPQTTVARQSPVRIKAPRVAVTQIVKTVDESAEPSEKAKFEDLKVQVEFRLNAPTAKSVAVAGSFNNWSVKKTPLRKEGEHWVTTLKLPRAQYEYRFVVDGNWVSDPNAKESTANPYGSSNSVLTV